MARLSIFLAMLLDAAAGHTIMNQIIAGGKTYPQGAGIYMPSSNVYQDDVNANTMACNGAPATGFASSSQVIEVKAGDTVTGAWLHELTSTGPGNDADNKVLASSHKGPVVAYMKKVTDATANPSSGPGNGWFKVAEAGLISSNQWAVDKLIADGGLQQVKIPSCLASGDYLMRFEIIALHSAGNAKGAQFYMECAQFRVTGAAAPQTPATYSIPGIYSATDPGILVSIYNNQGQPYPASYKIPGPAVFQCSANGGAAAPAPVSSTKPATSAAPTKATTVAPAPTKVATTTAAPKPTTFVTSVAKPATSVAPANPPASGTVAKWGQCGGQGYSGSKTCAAGSTCKYSNDWYSQCL